MWAHRALRGIPRYHHCRDEPAACRRYASWVPDEVIGFYEYAQAGSPSPIIITETGIYWWNDTGQDAVRFDDLHAVRGPQDKDSIGDIDLHLSDGRKKVVRVGGRDGNQRDVYSMVRFLTRIVEGRTRK
jgi:hypothetical protein